MTDAVGRFAEAYQRAAYARIGRPLPDYSQFDYSEVLEKFAAGRFDSRSGESWQTLDEIREEYRERIRVYVESAPNTHENPLTYGPLREFATEIEKAAADWLGDRAPAWPTIATLPSGEVNAIAYEVPDSGGQYAIFFDEGLSHFTHVFATAVAFAMPFKKVEGGVTFSPLGADVRRRLAEDPAPAARFLEVMLAYVVGGNPLIAGSPFIDYRWMAFGELYHDAMNLFVLGHEFGHVIARHSQSPMADHQQISADLPPEVDHAWYQELQADAIGTRLGVGALLARNYGVNICGMGIELFFGSVELIDRTVAILEHGDEDHARSGMSHTHPPALLRRSHFRNQMLPRILPEEHVEETVRVCERTETLLSLLWEAIRPALVDLHREGVRPGLQFLSGRH